MTSDIRARLRALGLHTAADGLDDIIDVGTKKRWSPQQLLEYIVEFEDRERARKGLERRMTRSRIGRFKPSSLAVAPSPPGNRPQVLRA